MAKKRASQDAVPDYRNLISYLNHLLLIDKTSCFRMPSDSRLVKGYQSSRRRQSHSPGIGPNGLERRPT